MQGFILPVYCFFGTPGRAFFILAEEPRSVTLSWWISPTAGVQNFAGQVAELSSKTGGKVAYLRAGLMEEANMKIVLEERQRRI